MRRLLADVTSFGVKKIVLFQSARVEKSFWQSPALDDEKIKNYLVTGLQQAKDTMLPSVSFKRLFKPFVEDELPAIIASQRALIAHPSASNPCPNNIDSPCVLAIGPEGGFTDYEVGKFIEAGFENIHLGNRILRVENAITALTSKLYQF